jgi:myosin heavy subunit
MFSALSAPGEGTTAAAQPIRQCSLNLSEAHVENAPDDLLRLEDFNDASLVRSLWTRYEQGLIYTWVGSVLVSVNPYRDVGVFAEEVAIRYASNWPPQAPHLYAVVKSALVAPEKRHALLVTGESGAGKTEATRAVLAFLAMRHATTDHVRDRLLKSTPVLEAFGNAQTRQNTNSSRFGKFVEVHLSAEGAVLGATLQPYMLEASRVAGDLPQGERAYHVFYILRAVLSSLVDRSLPEGAFWRSLASTPAWTELAKMAGPALAASKRLDNGPKVSRCVEWFQVLSDGLAGTGMLQAEIVESCRIVAAVALLGDVGASESALTTAAALLQIQEKDLTTFLTRTEMSVGTARKEKVYRSRSEHEAATLRASLAQELYASLFGWLTRLVGRGIAPVGDPNGMRRLGILDLYGFEVFMSNGFEQLLINYCNERLQQFFNRQVFTTEAEEYKAEGLDVDGQFQRLLTACQLQALSLLEGEPGSGLALFAIVNDHSRCGFHESSTCGSSSGNALADSITVSCGAHAAFCRRTGRDGTFGIQHFAGEVFYDATQFVRKNSSAHRPDIVSFLHERGSAFVRDVLSAVDTEAACGEAARPAGRPKRKLFGRTLIASFQQDLNELCATLEVRQCHYVRCLRPNDNQAPLLFNDASMLRQCRYSGLLEATSIRRQGYAHRRPLQAFVSRYSIILGRRQPGCADGPMDVARAIRSAAVCGGVSPEDACIGLTKAFIRPPALEWFEAARTRRAAQMVCAVLRSYSAQQNFRRLRHLALLAQACFRGHAVRVRVAQLRAEARAEKVAAAVVRLQRWWRSYTARGRLAATRQRKEEFERKALEVEVQQLRQVLYFEQERLMQMQQQESEAQREKDQVVVLTQEELQIQCREAAKKAVARSPLFANRGVTLPHSNETRSLHAVLGSEGQQRDHVAPSFTSLGRVPSAQARSAGTPRGAAVPDTLPAADFVVGSRASPQYIEGLRSCELPHSYTVATRACNSPPAARVGWTSMGPDARCRPPWLVAPPPAAASRVATVSFSPSMVGNGDYSMRRSFSARSLISRQLSPHPHVRSPLRSPSVIVHKPTKIPGTPFRPVLASCSPRSLGRHAATPRRVPRIANGHLSACAFSELPVACEVGSIRVSTPVHGSVTQAPTPARGGMRPATWAPPQAVVTVSSHALPPASITPRSPLRVRPSPLLDSSAMRVVHSSSHKSATPTSVQHPVPSSSHKSGTPTSVQHPKPPTGVNKENMLLTMKSPSTACA